MYQKRANLFLYFEKKKKAAVTVKATVVAFSIHTGRRIRRRINIIILNFFSLKIKYRYTVLLVNI